MQSTKRLLSITIIACCLLLAASYFLPTEALWSPSDAWQGYYLSSGQFVSGLNIGLVEVFPYAVGAIVLLILAILRWHRICTAVLVIFSTAWIVSLVYEVISIVRSDSYKFTNLWLTLAIVIIPSFVITMILTLWKAPKATTVLTFVAIMAAGSILQQTVSIAAYRLEDELFLNIGSVTGVTAGAVLFVSLLVQRQIHLASEKVVSDKKELEACE